MSVHPRPKQGNPPLPSPNFSNLKTNCETKKKKKKTNEKFTETQTVRTYVFHMLRTYVMILCNWLIL